MFAIIMGCLIAAVVVFAVLVYRGQWDKAPLVDIPYTAPAMDPAWAGRQATSGTVPPSPPSTAGVALPVARQKHGVPALLSFFLPGLGQLVKGNIFRALFIWAWLGVAGYFGVAAMFVQGGQGMGTLILLSLPIVYVWNLVDAYNH